MNVARYDFKKEQFTVLGKELASEKGVSTIVMKTKNVEEFFVPVEWSSLSMIFKKLLKFQKSELHDSKLYK